VNSGSREKRITNSVGKFERNYYHDLKDIKEMRDSWNYSFQQDILVQFEEKHYRLSYKNICFFVLREKIFSLF